MERERLPYSTIVLVFGIISVIIFCCYGVFSILFGLLAIILGTSALKKFKENPEIYSGEGNAKIGRVLGIIGLLLGILTLLFFVWVISIVGWDVIMSQDEELIRERMNDFFNN